MNMVVKKTILLILGNKTPITTNEYSILMDSTYIFILNLFIIF